MRLIRRVLYNASIISLFRELYIKYPHPIVIYDNSADETTAIYQAMTELNSQWISKSLEHDHSASEQRSIEIDSLHVFCVDGVLDSMHLIRNNILRTSNNYRIQNVILFSDQQPPHSLNVFAENERLHRNTMLCQRRINITCWHWSQEFDPSNPSLRDLLYQPINLNLLEIQIKAHSLPPNSYTPCFSGWFIFSGLNSMVAAEILSKLNATPRYCNERVMETMKTGYCNKRDKMNEDDAVALLRRMKYEKKHKNSYLRFVFDPRMIKYLFYEGAECKGPPDINMNIAALNENTSKRALIPTELSCISVILPKAPAALSFLRSTFYNSVESIAFFGTVLLFTIARILISGLPFAQWFDIFYSTFVVYLNQTSLKPKTESERVLYVFLLALSITTTVMLSGLIFTNMVNNPSSKPIQTVNDLAASEYKLFALNNMGNWMENLREDIWAKVVVVNYTQIINQLVTRNSTVALAINENLLGLLKSTWDSTSLNYRHRNDFYQMQENLHCGYFAYRISDDLALENDVNRILQQMVEHGFISAFKKWSMHLLKLVDLFRMLTTVEKPPINFESNHGIYYLWLCGVLFSSVVFICEKLYKFTHG